MDKINILMCCSDLSVKGGMVSVVKNYLGYDNWDMFSIKYIPTHVEKNKIIVVLYFAIEYLRLLFLMCTGKYQILYLHTAERGSFYRKTLLARTAKKFKIKTIMHHHAAEFELFYESQSEGKKKFIDGTLELVDLNIVLSNRLVSMITSKAPNANVKVLYNAVGTFNHNPYNKAATNVIFLGRLGKRKGAYDLLRAIKNIDKKINVNVRFYLCGDGDIENINKMVKDMEINHRIAHVGWIAGTQKTEFFKNSMINILPSYNEGLPMSILETMAYGIPNISTNIASIPEVIVSGINGILIEPGEIKAIEDALLMLIDSEELRFKFSTNSWKLINNEFGLEAHINKLKNYMLDLMGEA